MEDRATPVPVQGMPSGAVEVAAGSGHNCAVTSTGGVLCWGGNGWGQLGDGTDTRWQYPVEVSGLSSGVMHVTAGTYHSCALTTAGAVKCWGNNGYGQLGDGTLEDRWIPVDVVGLSSGVVAISAGYWYTCALLEGGEVSCWGDNMSGQLGPDASGVGPVLVQGLPSRIARIDAGYYHVCAATALGTAYCWGDGYLGAIGDGGNEGISGPREVIGLSGDVLDISAGNQSSCAVTMGGRVRCWGSDGYGRLGDGASDSWTRPHVVQGLPGGSAGISVGWNHSCAITSAGGVRCWGTNRSGELGDGSGMASMAPVEVAGLAPTVARLTAGGAHACVVTSTGGGRCWGNNRYHQLGDGTDAESSAAPVDVAGLSSGVVEIGAGYDHTCALTSAGGAKCWGNGFYGKLGNGTGGISSVPVDVVGLTSNVSAIGAGGDHTCAVTALGAVKCWGRNDHGQLGNGDSYVNESSVPVDVVGLTSGMVRVALGRQHTCALSTTGSLKCWGTNLQGQLGDPAVVGSYVPVDVPSLPAGVRDIAAGDIHSCALMLDGRVKCWGGNGSGELGDGTTERRHEPVDVVDLDGASEISVRDRSTCALLDTGEVKCWGDDTFGQVSGFFPGYPHAVCE